MLRSDMFRVVVLLFATVAQCVTLAAQSPRTLPTDAVPRDSAIAVVVGAGLAHELWPRVAAAAFDTTVRVADLQFPDAEAPIQWRALRQHLLIATRSRAHTPSDGSFWFVKVGGASVTGNTLRVHFSIGERYLCPNKGVWSVEETFELKATRATGGTWGLPEVRIIESSDGVSCAAQLEFRRGGA